MLEIRFKYRDKFTDGKWAYQECVCPSVEDCISFYGLELGCEYEILSVEDFNGIISL